MRKIKEKHFNGTTDGKIQAYEEIHRVLARRAASEGIVLLKNERQILPIPKDRKIALFGSGATKTVKGGTGSGDVNEREVVSIYDGLKNAGYVITTDDWIQEFNQQYDRAREDWKKQIWEKVEQKKGAENAFFECYCSTKFESPVGPKPEKTDAGIAIFVLSRNAGEGADRFSSEGDYYLKAEEKNVLTEICNLYDKVLVVINTGSLIDLSFVDELENICGLIYLQQPGMEAGNAFADVVSGDVSPCGKLTDSWPYRYEDFPNSATYSHNNGDVAKEKYEEGIYVGYRYFDSFEVPVRYGFGFGLSYSNFMIRMEDTELEELGTENPKVIVNIAVKNTGRHYSGKEVVQVYISCPDGRIEKEYRRLAGFAKTKELAPGETQRLKIEFPLYAMASFDEAVPCWTMERGCYGVWVGNSLATAKLSSMLYLEEETLFEKTTHICTPKEALKELSLKKEKRQNHYEAWVAQGRELGLNVIVLKKADVITREVVYHESNAMSIADSSEAAELVRGLSVEQLILLATGDPARGQGSVIGAAGISVPGSAGETSKCAVEQGIASIVLADGPAGLRLTQQYEVSNGNVINVPFEQSVEGGFLMKEPVAKKGTIYFQYCTAMPVGTMLAQTWNQDLVQAVGRAIGEEMQEFQVTLWLAPGMNIHRNPLCGRNFEYYSEDPVLSGCMAAAMTLGVQENSGCGTTIKHFACNNQEDNRMASDSILSERALREIYLKGFEIAVKTAQPMAMMTSYNLINGVHAANNFDLCTKVARDEWKFEGMIMTDWTTTHVGEDCTAAGCMRAGNDLIMPGIVKDHENIKKELKDKTLSEEELQNCVKHTVEVILKSNQYEDMQ